MSKKKKTLTSEETKKLWEELKELQIPKSRVIQQNCTVMKHKQGKKERDEIKRKLNDLKIELSIKSEFPGSLCIFLHTQLKPLYRSTGIEVSRVKEHPCLLAEKYQGQEHWLWGTSNKGRVKKNLNMLKLNLKRHIVKIPYGCAKEINYRPIEKEIYSITSLEKFDELVDKSKRRIPNKDTFLGAHWKLFYTPRGDRNYNNLNRYLGTIPDNIFDKIISKINN